jgi:hypothetical protein
VKHTVFIQTNPVQIIGALVAEHAFRRNSAHNEKFDIRIINTADHPFYAEHEGRSYLRGKTQRTWLNSDLQSFTTTRFMPPELMGYDCSVATCRARPSWRARVAAPRAALTTAWPPR